MRKAMQWLVWLTIISAILVADGWEGVSTQQLEQIYQDTPQTTQGYKQFLRDYPNAPQAAKVQKALRRLDKSAEATSKPKDHHTPTYKSRVMYPADSRPGRGIKELYDNRSAFEALPSGEELEIKGDTLWNDIAKRSMEKGIPNPTYDDQDFEKARAYMETAYSEKWLDKKDIETRDKIQVFALQKIKEDPNLSYSKAYKISGETLREIKKQEIKGKLALRGAYQAITGIAEWLGSESAKAHNDETGKLVKKWEALNSRAMMNPLWWVHIIYGSIFVCLMVVYGASKDRLNAFLQGFLISGVGGFMMFFSLFYSSLEHIFVIRQSIIAFTLAMFVSSCGVFVFMKALPVKRLAIMVTVATILNITMMIDEIVVIGLVGLFVMVVFLMFLMFLRRLAQRRKV